ncbi:MAG: biopolymer transporter Tol [Candidatus Marinimicrobia bacterium]|nr:biopolymer transporter Tol [Candidatus Neomarinimicrobiota bacterium]MCF7828700.1 biopolymer transporter Tol [Candidatus Neomarinimicrobiota bacterium]MCF7880441.1 biopolymer transporter Tol [Candidatus Neomarinimicrobiota bacterium]
MKKQIYLHTIIGLAITIATFFVCTPAMGQSFGQNKVQYKDFEWSFIRSDNFEVYFYPGHRDLAVFTAETAEKALQQISKELDWKLTERISIIVYASHNDFQQTNVTLSYLPEGVGGFTELFKNRIVVPYEGDYEQFRHVIHHELVHGVINDFLYGGSIQSIVSGRVTVQLPGWMSEGYPEYSSMYWDTKADMILRDLAVNGQLPRVQQLNGYLSYKGGQAVMKYISDTYGEPKIGELFNQIKRKRSVEAGVKAALGGGFEELSKRWRKYLRKQYWPDIEGRKDVQEISRQLTDHEELKNYYNIAPSISPDGGRIAILSDRDGYADIYIISTQDGEEIKKIVSGNRTPDFEELKWLQSGITWSPDGERIALTSKAGDRDALHIINVETEEKKSYTLRVPNLFTADWSPDGKKMALVGHDNAQSDIYVYDLQSKELTNITNDLYSDTEPKWSPDGSKIAFVSDRNGRAQTPNEPMDEFNYTNKDVYVYSIEDQSIERITDSPGDENYPVWSHTDNKVAYTSDESGVYNIYIHDMDSGEQYAITNILTGIQQLTWSSDDSRLIFSGYREGGWDVYTLTNPLEIEPGSVTPPLTNFRKRQNEEKMPQIFSKPTVNAADLAAFSVDEDEKGTRKTARAEGREYSKYVFAPGYDWQASSPDSAEEAAFRDTLTSKNDSGEYVEHDYKTRFTLDLINSQAAYNTFFGFQGSTVFMFSDILGNHRFELATDLFIDLQNSSYYLTYYYLKKQTNYGLTLFNFPNFFRDYYSPIIYRYRNYGTVGSVSRPFSKFTRIDFDAMYYNVEMQTLQIPPDHPLYRNELIQTIIPSVSFVYDNSIFGYTGPHDGTRFNLSYSQSPRYNENSLEYQTVEFDFRKYWMINREYSAAFRLTGGASEGENAQRFFMGGVPNWFNRDFRNDLTTYVQDPENIYFSKFIMPVRGARYYERAGTRYALLNAEFRFPFIQYFMMRFPLPVFFQNIRGNFFWDSGVTWFNDDLSFMKVNDLGQHVFDDLVAGYGYGFRINMGYFLLKIDVAWAIDSFHIFGSASSPKYYFSLGTDF